MSTPQFWHSCSILFRLRASKLFAYTALLGYLLFCALTFAQATQASTSAKAIEFAETAYGAHQVHYAFSGDLARPGVLFIHGTPGSWQAFRGLLANPQLQQEFFMVSLDRPGWGLSHLPAQLIDGDFTLQARAIRAVMDQYPAQRWILVGHSLGASLAPRVALLGPDKVHGLMLLAGSLDPKLGRPRWYNRLAHTWLAKRLISAELGRSNDEIMALSGQLKKLSEDLRKTRLPASLVVIQGHKDSLVSPRNTHYVETHWQNHFASVQILELPDAGHFLPWQQSPLLIESLRQLAQPKE